MPITADNYATVQQLLDSYESDATNDLQRAPLQPDIKYTIASLRTFATNVSTIRSAGSEQSGRLSGALPPQGETQDVAKPASKDREEIQIFSFHSTPEKSKDFGLILREETGHLTNRPSRKPWRRSITLGADQLRSLGETTVGQLRVELIIPRSYLERDGRLRLGDELLSINGQVLVNCDELKASKLLDNALKSGSVCLAVLRKVKRRAPLPPNKRNSIASVVDITNRSTSPEITETPPSEAISQLENFTNSILHRRSNSLKVRGNNYLGTNTRTSGTLDSRRPGDTSKRRAPGNLQGGVHFPADEMPIKRFNKTKSSHHQTLPVISRSDSVLSRTITEAKKRKREVVKIHLVKDRGSLGIQIAGGKNSSKGDVGIFVAGLDPGSPAERDGRLEKGDEILMINGNSLLSVTHQDVAQLLAESGSIVQLVLARKRKRKKRIHLYGSGTSDTSDSSSMSSQFSTPRGSPAVPSKQYHSQENLLRGGGLSSGSASPLSAGSPMIPSRASDLRHRLEAPDLRSASTSPLSPMKSKDKRSFSSRSDLPPFRDTIEISLMKGGFGQGLGFNIIDGGFHGRGGIFVRSIFPGGPAAMDGSLREEDEILTVNGESLEGLSQQQAISKFKQVMKGRVTLTVARRSELPSPTSSGSSILPPPRRKRKKSQTDDGNVSPDDQKRVIREVTIINEPGSYFGVSVICLPIPDKAHESGVFILDLAPNSPAEKTGQLCIGARIWEVNGQSLHNANSTNSVQYFFDNLPLGLVKLKMSMFKNPGKSHSELAKAQELALRLGKSPQEERKNLVPRRDTLTSEATGSRSMVTGSSQPHSRDKEEEIGATTTEVQYRSTDSGESKSASPTRRNKTGGNRQGGKRRAMVVLSTETLPLGEAVIASSPPTIPPHKSPVSRGQGNPGKSKDLSDLKARHIYDEVALEPMDEGPPGMLNSGRSQVGRKDISVGNKRIARIGSEMSRQFDDYVRQTVIEDVDAERKRRKVPEDVLRRLRHLPLGEDLWMLRLERSPGERLGMGLNIEHTQENNSLTEGVFVKSIHPGGAAARLNQATGGGLYEGDEIVMANNLVLKKEAYNKVVKHLSILPDEFTLVVARGSVNEENNSNVSLLPKEEECLWDKIERHLGTKLPRSEAEVDSSEEVELKRLWHRLESELMNLTDSAESSSNQGTNSTRPFSDEFKSKLSDQKDRASSPESMEDDVSVSDMSDTEERWVQRCNGNGSDDEVLSPGNGGGEFKKLEDLLSMDPADGLNSKLEFGKTADDTPCFTPESLSPKRDRKDYQSRPPQSETYEATPVTDIDDILSLSDEEEGFTTSTPAAAIAGRQVPSVSAGNGKQPFLERLLDYEPALESLHDQEQQSASSSTALEPTVAPENQLEVETKPNVGSHDSEMAENGSQCSTNGAHIRDGIGHAKFTHPSETQFSEDTAGQTEGPVMRYKKNQDRGASKSQESSVYVSPLSSPEKGKGEFRLSSASGNLSVSTYSLSDLSMTDTDSDALSMQSHDSPLRMVKKADQAPVQSGSDSQNTKKRLIKADDFSFEDSSDEELTLEVDDLPDRNVSGQSDVTMKSDESNTTVGSGTESSVEVSSPSNQSKSFPPVLDKDEKQLKETPTSPRLPPDGHEFPRGVTCHHDGMNSPLRNINILAKVSHGKEDLLRKGLYVDTTPSVPEPKRRIPASPFVVSPEKPLFAPLFEPTPSDNPVRSLPEATDSSVSKKESSLGDSAKRHSTSSKSPELPEFTTQNKYFPELAEDFHKKSRAAVLPSAARRGKASVGQKFFSNLTANSKYESEPGAENVGKKDEELALGSDEVNRKVKGDIDEEPLTKSEIFPERGVPSSVDKDEGEFVKSSLLLHKLRSDLNTSRSRTKPVEESTRKTSSESDLPLKEDESSSAPTAVVNSQKLAVPKRLSAVLGKFQGKSANTGYEFRKSGASSGDGILAPRTKFLEDQLFTGFEGYKKFSWEQDLKKRESKEIMPPVRKGSFKDNSDIKKRLAARLQKLPVTEIPDEEKFPNSSRGPGKGGTHEFDGGSHIKEKKPRLEGGEFELPAAIGGSQEESRNKPGEERTLVGARDHKKERQEKLEPGQRPSPGKKQKDESKEHAVDQEMCIKEDIREGVDSIHADVERGLFEKKRSEEHGTIDHERGCLVIDSSRRGHPIGSGDGHPLNRLEINSDESEKPSVGGVTSGLGINYKTDSIQTSPEGDEVIPSLRPNVNLGETKVEKAGTSAVGKVGNLGKLSRETLGINVMDRELKGDGKVEDSSDRHHRNLEFWDNSLHEGDRSMATAQSNSRGCSTDTNVLSGDCRGVKVVLGESSIFPLDEIDHMANHKIDGDCKKIDVNKKGGSVPDGRIDVGDEESSNRALPPLPTSPHPLPTPPMPEVNMKPVGQESADGETDEIDLEVGADDLDEGVFEIVIDKKPEELLGIQIDGGSDTTRQCIYVKRIHADSAASRSGRLKRGDQLLDVSGTCMVGITHGEAMDVLLDHKDGPLHMVVSRQRRDAASSDDESSGMEDLATELLAHVQQDSDDELSTEERECFGSPDVYCPTSPDSLSSGIPQSHFKPMSSTPDEEKVDQDGGTDMLTDLQIKAVAKRKMIKEGVHPRYLQRSMSESSNSTVLLSTTELDKLIDDANQSLEENDDSNVSVIVLHKEEELQGLGLTVAGGVDQEVREITVHKVIPGGLAHKDGRIQKGDRLLSINGKVLKDATHAELLKLLKTTRSDVVIVVARPQDLEDEEEVKTLNIDLVKSSAGLGFSIAGGKSSPRGDLPITVKKIFAGGAADRSKELNLDDEIVEVNGKKMANMTHFDAWTFLKSVPNGVVKLKIIPASR